MGNLVTRSYLLLKVRYWSVIWGRQYCTVFLMKASSLLIPENWSGLLLCVQTITDNYSSSKHNMQPLGIPVARWFRSMVDCRIFFKVQNGQSLYGTIFNIQLNFEPLRYTVHTCKSAIIQAQSSFCNASWLLNCFLWQYWFAEMPSKFQLFLDIATLLKLRYNFIPSRP